MLHELIDGDLGALVKATRFVRLEVRFTPVQRRGVRSTTRAQCGTRDPLNPMRIARGASYDTQ